jgi:CRP-like cAMP-binding protein
MQWQRGKLTPSNQLLMAFDRASRTRVSNSIEITEVKEGCVICWAGDRIEHVYFPDSTVLSMLTVLGDGSAIETANIGCEGAFGLFEAMYTHSSFSQCLVLMTGALLRIPFNELRYLFEHNLNIRTLFICYAEALRDQIQQTVACYALHTTQQRLCGWLLTMDDRKCGRDLEFTHEFLAHVLGTNRKSVTLAARAMQNAGLISYQRGRIRILNRSGLEKASCECHMVVKRRFASFKTQSAVPDDKEDCA